MGTWDEVDERVLRWLLEQDSNPEWRGITDQLQLRGAEVEPRPEFAGELDSRQLDEALRRLEGHRLIAGDRSETVSYARWSRLRLTADGLIVLGEWPDHDRIAGVQGITAILARLAEESHNPADKRALRRTAGEIAHLGEGILGSTLESLGGEIA